MRTSRRLYAFLILAAGCKTTGTPASLKDDVGGGAVPPYAGPDIPDGASAQLSDFCVGGGDLSTKPVPNYDNPLVQAAVAKLNLVVEGSFAIHQSSYARILQKFQTTAPTDNSLSLNANTHDYLSYLCGEFRDRPTLIQAKLKWVARMNFLGHRLAGPRLIGA